LPTFLSIPTQSLFDRFQYEAAKNGHRIVAIFVLAGSNDVKYCGEKTEHDPAQNYPKTTDDLLVTLTLKLKEWSRWINAPVFLIGPGTPRNVVPTRDVPDVRLDDLDALANEEKIYRMAAARARICHWLARACQAENREEFDPRIVHFAEKPLLDVTRADYDGHHGKIENYHQAVAIRNTVSYVLQKSRIAENLTSKSSSRNYDFTSNVNTS
jgi:hypothetical protein